MLNGDKEKYLLEILRQIQQGRVALFLGAGASHASGGPTGRKLTELIKENFSNIDQSLNDFIEVCQDVIDTPPYSRNELEDFIKSKLDSLQPSRAHQIMTKYNWSSIFTTNFDDLIEVAYRITSERLKPCQSIYSERFQVNPSDRSKVYLFKVMGSITATEGESGHMVLSRADYHRALRRRQEYLRLLSDFIKSGIIIFIGYSFKDRIVLDIIDDLIGIYGKDRLPWSYALFEQLQPMDEKTQHMFSSRKIIPLEYSFDKFVNFLNEKCEIVMREKVSKNVHFTLRGYVLEISESDARQYAEYFEILNDEKINQESNNKDNFFMGINRSWGAFGEDWDFRRDLYISPKFHRTVGSKMVTGCLKDRLSEELKKYDIESNKAILLKGMAGTGKTMTLRRLAYDVYKTGEAPVIIVSPRRINFDYKLLASFIETLNHQLNQKIGEGQHLPPIKPLIVIDDAASLIRHVNRLKDYLTSRGRPALIVAAERTGEWDLMWKTFPFRLPEDNIYELDEQLTGDEKKRIIDHFYNLGYVQSKGVFWDDIIARSFENSYFATIYTLVHPSKKPLNEIIRDQYQGLSELTQRAFQYICCFYQFDLPINLELLIRSLKCPYEDFYSEVIGKDAAKVIFEEQDETGSVLYRSHHRIIARKTVEFFFGDPEIQKNIFLAILKEAVLTNRRERDICEKLLVGHIGPNANPKIFTHEQQRQMFSIICETNRIRSLMHHWGILEADDHQFSEAEKLLKRSLEIPRDDVEPYRGESDQNILTSLGSLYCRMGLDFVKKGLLTEAEECFQKAEVAFNDAKHGEFPNAYAYHGHANMWHIRANQTKNDIEKINFCAKALEILSIAKDNLNKEELQQIYELETLIWSQIGDDTKIAESLEILRVQFNSARGYYLIAEFHRRRSFDKEGEERKRLLELAMKKVEDGLNYFPNDEYCLLLHCKVLKELEPNNLNKYYDFLQRWKAVATISNARLLYELGRTSFILGYYDQSRQFFKELETGVGMGHKLRSRPRFPILDDKGNKKEFEGTIVSIFSSYEGYIRCDSLRSLRYNIGFRPIASAFQAAIGDPVKFFIEFSYRGPRAENVRKM